MQKVILIRYGELHLKGKNRPYFERKLFDSIKRALRGIDSHCVRASGRYYVENYAESDEDAIIAKLKKISGIYSVSVARAIEKSWDAITQNAVELMREEVSKRGGSCTFKVFSRRSDKTFPMNSSEMAPKLGGVILDAVPGTKVLMRDYDVAVGLEIREQNAYIYSGEILCVGGMPAGSNGKAALLLSGGIDSPVAGYMVQKRGVALECVHFHSFPYTGERAREKVLELAKELAAYCGSLRIHIVHFTDMQLAIHEKCPDSQSTVLIRRAMMEIAEKIAVDTNCDALVTGESIGQVASQTLKSLRCTDDAVTLPVFRPCIGMDKLEIMNIAREIGTYETSILPYEDCCTIFTPKHPVTSPKLEDIRASQLLVENWEQLKADALEKTEALWITAD